jgi:hypothetical protein
VDLYRIPLPKGRSMTLSDDQVRQIATGLGDDLRGRPQDGRDPPIISALCALPPEQRAQAVSVVLLRFGDKQDVESISRSCGLNPWQVWQLEESFRRALADLQPPRPPLEPGLASELEGSDTARVMSAEMLSNAIARGETVDLEREHEASLRAARD